MAVGIRVADGVTPELRAALKRSKNLSVPMEKIKKRVLNPAIAPAWSRSGLKAHSGKLKRAVRAWHGRKSAGISLKRGAEKGKDGSPPRLIMRGYMLSHGAKKGRYVRKKKIKVREHVRRGAQVVKSHRRLNPGSPWGDVKPYPFFPADRAILARKKRITRILVDHIEGRRKKNV